MAVLLNLAIPCRYRAAIVTEWCREQSIALVFEFNEWPFDVICLIFFGKLERFLRKAS
tara:strand:- start:26703 stop:26876 length:174 start_codon:yes stop_codon:yes gene_type:complete